MDSPNLLAPSGDDPLRHLESNAADQLGEWVMIGAGMIGETIAAKLLGPALPGVGAVVGHLVGGLLPDQRLDRLRRGLVFLGRECADLKQAFIEQRVNQEGMADLLEEVLRQGARPVSDERRQRLASFYRKALTDEDVEAFHQQRLLEVLGQVNDEELGVFRLHAAEERGSDPEFRLQAGHLLARHGTLFGGNPAEAKRRAIRLTYERHLEQLGLLEPIFAKGNGVGSAAIDLRTGATRIQRWEATNFGRLLLEYLDFAPLPYGSPSAERPAPGHSGKAV